MTIFNANEIMKDPTLFGSFVVEALTAYKADQEQTNDLYTVSRVIEELLEADAKIKLKLQTQKFFPTATAVNWDVDAVDRHGNYSVALSSIELSDGSVMNDESSWDLEEEEADSLANKYEAAEEAVQEVLYSMSLTALQEERFSF